MLQNPNFPGLMGLVIKSHTEYNIQRRTRNTSKTIGPGPQDSTPTDWCGGFFAVWIHLLLPNQQRQKAP